MIRRILVPKNARPVVSPTDAPPRRLSSNLDARTLVPSDLPQFELDPHSSIPSYFKLEVLGDAVVVPRDMPNTPLDAISKTPSYVPLTILDSRVAVPKDAHAAKLEPKQIVAIQDLPDVLDPDVLTTGEVNLMTKPAVDRTEAWNAVARVASIVFHFVVILLILLAPKIFPYHPPTDAEIARTITDLYIPSDLNRIAREPSAPRPKTPVVKVDPRLLRQLAPPREVQPAAPAQPEPPRETPAPPKPSPAAPLSQPHPAESPIRPQVPPPDAPSSLVLPKFSPGKALQESMQEAMKGGGSQAATYEGPIGSGYGGGGGGGGGGQGFGGNAVEILTPTEGVDFSTYIARVLASVKRNWYSVMPESARLGDKGKVVLQFRIMRNGVVPEQEPVMMGSSGKEPLDRAAASSIRASTPFEPLPSAFSGPYIELRFIFLYNIPLNSQTAQ
ncbi:MAG TPA: TonB C-terminal domain-containing protein [Verrucomicrobiae bacterium]|nr:TonB C-terminal domain-containing protein [Verrucomicrobiae bacterium]